MGVDIVKFELNVGDWLYIFGDDVFVQISEIVYDHNKIKHVYATNSVDGIFCDGSMVWICKKGEDPEPIFQGLSYDELEEREVKIV